MCAFTACYICNQKARIYINFLLLRVCLWEVTTDFDGGFCIFSPILNKERDVGSTEGLYIFKNQ